MQHDVRHMQRPDARIGPLPSEYDIRREGGSANANLWLVVANTADDTEFVQVANAVQAQLY